MNEPKLGRPQIKPNRKMTSFAINLDYINEMQIIQTRRNGVSLNDLYNEAIYQFIKSNKHDN